jgi:hypothetical protein
VSQVLSVFALICETASSVVFLSQGGWLGSTTQTLLAGTLAMLPAAHYLSDKLFERLTRDPVSDLAMQEAWQMPRRL